MHHPSFLRSSFPAVAVAVAGSGAALAQAAAARCKEAFADAARGVGEVAASHPAFPGIGRVRAEGMGSRFAPANYSDLSR